MGLARVQRKYHKHHKKTMPIRDKKKVNLVCQLFCGSWEIVGDVKIWHHNRNLVATAEDQYLANKRNFPDFETIKKIDRPKFCYITVLELKKHETWWQKLLARFGVFV